LQGDLVILSNVATFDDQGYYLISDKNSNRLVRTFSQWFFDACSLKLPKRRTA
jgi:hypothetical protein